MLILCDPYGVYEIQWLKVGETIDDWTEGVMIGRIFVANHFGGLSSSIALTSGFYTRNLIRRSYQLSRNMSELWSNVPLGPPDAILGITEAFKRDNHPEKVNLGVGAYRDDQGKPFVLESVREAESGMIKDKSVNKEYSTIAGDLEFTRLAVELAYGLDSKARKDNRIAVAQSISGTGALRIGASFLARFRSMEGKKPLVLLPTPTWGNHKPIFMDSGCEIGQYRYFDVSTNGLDIRGMLEDLKKAPVGSVVLLHACAHNPTGVDPSHDEWKEIEAAIKDRHLIPFFDMAYQGFASGKPDQDAWALRYFVDECNHQVIMAQSFAKNMGLYGERVGTVSVVCKDAEERERVESQIKILIRPMYSNPPIHGAQIVKRVLGDVKLNDLWLTEVGMMADRIRSMRALLAKELLRLGSKRNWSHITDQIGMFCYTGLTVEQVDVMTKEHHIYMTKDGRISIAGLNSANVSIVARAMHAVTNE